MDPQLFILRGKTTKDYTPKKIIRFAIVDQDENKRYPANFICILPQHMNSATADSSVFAKTFKEKRLDLAKKLLTDALEKEDDPKVKKEINNRLKQIAPKPTWQGKNFSLPAESVRCKFFDSQNR
jgi:hypothetical protein